MPLYTIKASNYNQNLQVVISCLWKRIEGVGGDQSLLFTFYSSVFKVFNHTQLSH